MIKEDRSSYLYFIRSIAILDVFFSHAGMFVSGTTDDSGFHATSSTFEVTHFLGRGVILSFMLSAFVLFGSLHRSGYTGERRQTVSFYLKRLFRIVPLFLCFLVVSLFLLHTDLWHILVSGTFILPNFLPSYMNIGVPNQWSLMIEMLFYLFLPILFLRIKTVRAAERMAFATIFLSSFFLLTINLAVYFVYPTAPIQSWYTLVRYSILEQFPNFILGAMLFFLFKEYHSDEVRDKRKLWLPIVKVLGWSFGCYLIFSVVFYLLSGTISFSFATPWVYVQAATMMALFALIAEKWHILTKLPMVERMFEFTGKISYSIYLTHWYALVLIEKSGFYQYLELHQGRVVQYVVLASGSLTLTILVSYLAHRYIGEPGQRIGERISRSILNKKSRLDTEEIQMAKVEKPLPTV